MKVLVAVASEHGATIEIASAIGEVLAGRGLETTVMAADDVGPLDGYQAMVLGSAVYMGSWMKPARELAERLQTAGNGRPVWLFSSGPVGDPPLPAEHPVDVTHIQELTHARDHRVFSGKLVRKELRLRERALVTAMRVQEGDFRDWDDIRSWASSIADYLGAAG